MKKNKIIEIVIATILVVSLAASYKYYITDKKNHNENASDTTVDNMYSNDNPMDMLVELEEDAFVRNQMKEWGEVLIIYGSENNNSMIKHTTDHFQFEFEDFEVYDRVPKELIGEMLLSSGRDYNEDGSMKDENTCIAKVDVTITNMSDRTAATSITGFRCYQVDENWDDLKTGTNKGSVFLDSYKGKQDLTQKDCFPRIESGESYKDTIYFIIDKPKEKTAGYMIQIDPFGMSTYHFDKLKNTNIKNNGYGYIKVKYTDMIKN